MRECVTAIKNIAMHVGYFVYVVYVANFYLNQALGMRIVLR